MEHGDPYAAELDLELVGCSPIPDVRRVAIADHRADRREGLEVIEHSGIQDVAGMEDVIGRFEVGPGPHRDRPGHAPGVGIGNDGNFHPRNLARELGGGASGGLGAADLGYRGVLAADRAVRVASDLDLPEPRRLRVEREQPPDQRLSVTRYQLECLVSL
jgi:hypothetical protein